MSDQPGYPTSPDTDQPPMDEPLEDGRENLEKIPPPPDPIPEQGPL